MMGRRRSSSGEQKEMNRKQGKEQKGDNRTRNGE